MDNGFDWNGGELRCWDKGLCSVAFTPFPPPLLPFIPLPIHLSCSNHLGSCHLIQLITDGDGLWETRLVHGFAHPQHALIRDCLLKRLLHVGM